MRLRFKEDQTVSNDFPFHIYFLSNYKLWTSFKNLDGLPLDLFYACFWRGNSHLLNPKCLFVFFSLFHLIKGFSLWFLDASRWKKDLAHKGLFRTFFGTKILKFSKIKDVNDLK